MRELLILAPPIPPHHLGGDGKFALDIAKALSKRDIKVTLFSPSYNGVFEDNDLNKLRILRVPIVDKESKDGWDIPIWEPEFVKKRDLTFLEHLERLRLINNKTWIHEIGGSIYNSLLVGLHKNRQIEYSCHMQFVLANYDKFIPNNRPYKEITLRSQREFVTHAKSVFFLSETDAEPFKGLLDTYTIIPNGVELLSTKENLSSLKTKKLRLFVGGRLYSEMKGGQKIFPILSTILSKNDNVELHICAPDKSYFELFSKDAIERIVYHGWTSAEETKRVIGKCDVTLMPSLYEPFGLLALESMANGVPVLGTNTGGLAELIKPGINGEFIDLNKPEAVENLIMALVSLKKEAIRTKYEPYKVRASVRNFDISNIGNLYIENLCQITE